MVMITKWRLLALLKIWNTYWPLHLTALLSCGSSRLQLINWINYSDVDKYEFKLDQLALDTNKYCHSSCPAKRKRTFKIATDWKVVFTKEESSGIRSAYLRQLSEIDAAITFSTNMLVCWRPSFQKRKTQKRNPKLHFKRTITSCFWKIQLWRVYWWIRRSILHWGVAGAYLESA